MAKKVKTPKTTVTVSVFYYLESNGDGSASPRFYRTQEARDAAVEKMENDDGNGFSESCEGSLSFEVDPKTGEIVVVPMKHKFMQPFEEDSRDEEDDE